MKRTVIYFYLCFFSLSLKAQTAQEYFISYFEKCKENGASNFILKATLCSLCEGTYEAIAFTRFNKFEVRYIKYLDGYNKIVILKDSTFSDDNIKSIIDTSGLYSDSIFNAVSKVEKKLVDVDSVNGKKVYADLINHGKYIYFIYYDKSVNNLCASSMIPSVYIKKLNSKAYFYWLLNSVVDNYCLRLFNR